MDMSKLPIKIVGMPNGEYHGKRKFLSRSYLTAVAEGGGEVQQFLDQGHSLFSGNTATRKGSEWDTLVQGLCEGKPLKEQLRVPPADVLGANGARTTKAYKEWEAQQTDCVVCSAEQAWQYGKMMDSLMANDSARRLIERTTETQVSVFFELDGHPVKVRPDGCCEDLWWDLKTTSSKWSQVVRSIGDYGYGEQAWLYTQGAMAIGYEGFRMPFVFCQTVPPFGCIVRTLPDDFVGECGERMLQTMELVKLRRETGEYLPLDHGETRELEIPAWMRNKQEVF